MSKQSPTEMSKSVMSHIKSGQTHMKPRLYYTLLGAISVLAAIAFALAATYVYSIFFFWLRIQTADNMAYGARSKLSESLESFPWWLLVGAVLLMFLAIFMIRRQGKMYRYKTSTIAIVLVSISVLLGFILSFANFGERHFPARMDKSGQGHERWRDN